MYEAKNPAPTSTIFRGEEEDEEGAVANVRFLNTVGIVAIDLEVDPSIVQVLSR